MEVVGEQRLGSLSKRADRLNSRVAIPDFYHYFERSRGPFLSLSELDAGEAERLLEELRQNSRLMASFRGPRYLARRHELEMLARKILVEKGGRPETSTPGYMVMGPCPWLESWYVEPASLCIPVGAFDPLKVSFSYGDLFPTFGTAADDGKEYRRQVYTFAEIWSLVDRYGYPQDWNPDGSEGPERYIEVHVWER
jgi:hypothetical protein